MAAVCIRGCAAWQLECKKMKRMQRAYKETIHVLRNDLEKDKAEIEQHEEGLNADVGRETKEKESASRAYLEKEVSDVKSDLSALQQSFEQRLQKKE